MGLYEVWICVLFLFVCMTLQDVPDDWKQRVSEAQMLYADIEPTNQQMMPSVGNGYVSTVVGSDTIYVSGVYNGLNTQGPSHRAVIPATNAFTVVGGQPVGSAIDLERATFYRRVIIESAPIEQRWYAHQTKSSLLVHEIFVDNSKNMHNLTFKINLKTRKTPDFNITPVPGTGYTQYKATISTPEEPGGQVISISVVTSNVPDNYLVTASTKQTFYIITAIRTNLDSTDPEKTALSDYLDAVNIADTLHTMHVAAWLQLWESRIEITGDFHLAQVVNASLYYILSSVRSDWPYSLSPGSLSSNGYNGHVFWDCETWMYPALLLAYPDIARGSLLQYRLDRMEGAALKAKSYNKGYSGLMFPWESAFTGQEVCPSSAPTGELEQHISGDIAFAFRQYYYLTKDQNWLEKVYPLIEGIAEFWSSRVTHDVTHDQYTIDGVIPPDEYAFNVNNSVYTNVVASISLDFAVFCGKLLNHSIPANWNEISSKLKIPVNIQQNIHLEYDTYNGEVIKQADVTLLGFPLMYSMTNEMRKNDLVYYQQRTDKNGPAMTYAMETIAWLELGSPDEAAKVWNEAWANARDPFMVWTETPTGGTVNFITGAGGFLQAVLFGYGGIRLKMEALTFDPQLPPSVTSMKFGQINYLNNKLQVIFDSKIVTVTKTNNAGTQLYIKLPTGNEIAIVQNKEYPFTRGAFSIYAH